MKETVQKWLPKEPPKSIVVISAHWESDPISITSSANPSMLFDYHGFPPDTYKYEYNAPGNRELAIQIRDLLQEQNLKAELNEKRGFDHGVFVPLMLMYPKADIPVVCVSLHKSLSAEINWNIGQALAPLRNEGVLILGSGFTFHNLPAFFNPTPASQKASTDFNEWLKKAMLETPSGEEMKAKLSKWDQAPGGRIAHPREEHLLPLFVAAASAPGSKATLIHDVPANSTSSHAISSYMFGDEVC